MTEENEEYMEETEEQQPENEVAVVPPREFETELDFNNELINPKAEPDFPWLTRDKVLGNITPEQLMFAMAGLDQVKLLTHMGLPQASAFFEAEISSLFIMTRSINGFESKLLRTNISTYEGLDDESKDSQRRGFKKLFGRSK